MRTRIAQSKRLVVKVGSALVTNNGTGLALGFIADCAQQIAALNSEGREILLVSSGAIAAGMQRLGWSSRPHAMHDLQAAAAVGQMGLAQAYETVFAERGLKAAQILLTHEDLADRTRHCRPCSATVLFPSSTRTIPSLPTRSSSATTIRSVLWSQISSRPRR
jgi:glutamate 5-kinase